MLNHWKRPWCWERQRARGEGDDRGWDDWMAPWIWVSSGSWWWTGRPGVLLFMGSKRVGHDWATELNWTEDVSNSLQIHGLQCARLPCPSLSPRVCSYSCRLSQMQLSNHLILHCPFLLLPSVFPWIRVFSSESAVHIRWPKYWSFSFSLVHKFIKFTRLIHECP